RRRSRRRSVAWRVRFERAAFDDEPTRAAELDHFVARVDPDRVPALDLGGGEEAADEAADLDHPRTPLGRRKPAGEARDLAVVGADLCGGERGQAWLAVAVARIVPLDLGGRAARMTEHEPAAPTDHD